MMRSPPHLCICASLNAVRSKLKAAEGEAENEHQHASLSGLDFRGVFA
jgi:hypothetical protein